MHILNKKHVKNEIFKKEINYFHRIYPTYVTTENTNSNKSKQYISIFVRFKQCIVTIFFT